MKRLALLLLAIAPASASAEAALEHFVQPPLPGFVLGHKQEASGQTIEEYVPQGETVQRWTRMVTVQRFSGLASRVSPEQLIGAMGSGLGQGCPGAATSAPRSFDVGGRPAAQFRADCPKNPATSLPETFVARAVAGATDMHMVQVAFRRLPSAADIAWAERHLEAATLCGAGNAAPICAAR